MPRPNRLKSLSPRAFYHVTNRIVRGEFFFEEEDVREWVYEYILFVAKCFYVELHGITVMSNHYHLVFSFVQREISQVDVKRRFELLQSENKHPRSWNGEDQLWHSRFGDLSEFMKCINQGIALEINRRRNLKGRVWDRRFFSTLLEDGEALLNCLAYVELNPVRANMCKTPSEYRWCSAGRFALGGQKRAGVVVPALKIFSGIARHLHQQALGYFVDYLAKKECGDTCSLPSTWDEWTTILDEEAIRHLLERCLRKTKWLTNSLILGSKSFIDKWIGYTANSKASGPLTPIAIFPGLFNGKVRRGGYLG